MEIVCNIPAKLTGNSFYLYSNRTYINNLILTNIYRLRNKFCLDFGCEPGVIKISRNIYHEFLSSIDLFSLVEKNGYYSIIDPINEVIFELSSNKLRDFKINHLFDDKKFILADYEYKLKVELESEY